MRALAAALLAASATACGGDGDRRTAATTAERQNCGPGVHEFTLKNGQPVDMRVTPPGARPYALVVALHGAGGSPDSALDAFSGAWKVPGLVLVAPAAKGPTWTILFSDQDRDLESVDLAVAEAWARCPIDRDRIALGGFSDGASYALSLGLLNGDLFRRVLAFSPGFFVGGEAHGKPSLFVSHGVADTVLPIDRCSRRIVPLLQKQGYDVTFRVFDGGHEIPSAIAQEGFRWVAAV